MAVIADAAERINRAAEEFEAALSEDGRQFDIHIHAIECTRIDDQRPRYQYAISIEISERIR